MALEYLLDPTYDSWVDECSPVSSFFQEREYKGNSSRTEKDEN